MEKVFWYEKGKSYYENKPLKKGKLIKNNDEKFFREYKKIETENKNTRKH